MCSRRPPLPLQPIRPDQGLAARRLPADQGRAAGAQPQPGELLAEVEQRRSSPPTWCWHRPEPRQAARPLLATRTHTATASARTTCNCQSTSRNQRSTAITRTADALRHNGTQPVYAPNTRRRTPTRSWDPSWAVSGDMVRSVTSCTRRTMTSASRALLISVLSETDRAHLVSNLVGHVSQSISPTSSLRAGVLAQRPPEIADGIARGLGLPVAAPAGGAGA